MNEAFVNCDQDLKQSLLALSPDVRMSKGHCNAGSCAVVALFVGSTLFVANVGDCAAVVGKGDGAGASAVARGVQVSIDHSCSNASEVRLVLARSRDRHPIRLSKDDQGGGELTLGVKRVAGSLAVTRAFGDFYLKCEELSTAPFKVRRTTHKRCWSRFLTPYAFVGQSKLPYITVEPSVATIELDGSEKYLVLASDGLWEVLTSDEAIQIVHKFGTGVFSGALPQTTALLMSGCSSCVFAC
jgi:pyruvate dehydrogenase phosphatase